MAISRLVYDFVILLVIYIFYLGAVPPNAYKRQYLLMLIRLPKVF